jgi:hypothetical protein
MRYTVTWTPVARVQLVDLWIRATDRNDVSAASDQIDFVLRDDPETKGTPFGSRYVLIADPLAALYEIDLDDCMVRVLQVRRSIP